MTVGELICRLVEFGDMEAPVLLLGQGWLKAAEDDLGQHVLLHAEGDS